MDSARLAGIQVAATALEHDLTLVKRNGKDFGDLYITILSWATLLHCKSTLHSAHYQWDLVVPHKRTHVILPEDLLAEIDALVSQRGRSAFLVEVLRNEVRRLRLLQILSDPTPIWKDEDHPELAQGSDAWVRRIRDEDGRAQRERLGDWLDRPAREDQ